MHGFPKTLVFILGCQRSGTTWLANIFDASPDTLLFMEPFAPSYNIFPEFPETTYFLEASSPYLDQLLQVEMPLRLFRYKSLIFPHSISDPKWFRLDRWFANNMYWFVPGIFKNRIRKFHLLNLNRMDSNYPPYPKNKEPFIWAIKELRLAGKIPVLLHAFPTAHFIVIIRHPCAVVDSILNYFEQGHLGELRQDLETYLEKIEVQKVSLDYQDLIMRCRKGTLAHKVALYWRISYETMFKNLEKHPQTQLLIYEQLASQPIETAKKIFTQLGIPWSDSLTEYLFYSTSVEKEKPGPITTVRKSATYYRAWTEKISESTRQAVLEMTNNSFLMKYFEPYYTL